MSKYIKYYDEVSAATSDTSIVSPNLSYINGGGVNKLLMLDTGVDDTPLEIKEVSGEIVINEKNLL